MNAEILSVGTELLMGQIANTDAQFLSRGLNELGINVYYHTVVGDNPARLKKFLAESTERSDLVILTGGLGPTPDDLTKETLAEFLGLPMEEDPGSMRVLKSYFAEKLDKAMTPNNAKQAFFPRGSFILENPNGTAPGCVVEDHGTVYAVLPGPPRELQPMFTERLKPWLMRRSDAAITSRMLHSFGVGESEAAHRLDELLASANPTVATYVGDGDVLLRVTARTLPGEDPAVLLDPMVAEVKKRMGGAVFSEADETLPQVVVRLLQECGKTVACAESCTGGWVSSMIVDVPGASDVLLEGCVTYSNEAKMRRLGVPASILEAHGAVSAECARAMAEGMRRTSGADYALATTGIAGPGGGTPEKPVGLIYGALAGPEGTVVQEYHLHRSRTLNRRTTALNVLNLLRKTLLGIN